MDWKNAAMERTEHWRQRLIELKGALALSQVALATAMDVPANYVSRLLYEPGKKGRKNLGMDTMRALRDAYKLSADWFDLPLGSSLPTHGRESPGPLVASEPANSYNVVSVQGSYWPFTLVSQSRLMRLKHALGHKVAADAFREIDAHLNFVVSQWEAKVAKQKKSS